MGNGKLKKKKNLLVHTCFEQTTLRAIPGHTTVNFFFGVWHGFGCLAELQPQASDSVCEQTYGCSTFSFQDSLDISVTLCPLNIPGAEHRNEHLLSSPPGCRGFVNAAQELK